MTYDLPIILNMVLCNRINAVYVAKTGGEPLHNDKYSGNQLLGDVLYLIVVILNIVGIVGIIAQLFPLSHSVRLVTLGVVVISFLIAWLLYQPYKKIFHVPAFTDDDILRVLNHEWKTVLEVKGLLSLSRPTRRTLAAVIHGDLPIVALKDRLNKLCEKGWAEKALENHKSGGHPLTDVYRLTQDGHRQKDAVIERAKPQPSGVFRPETA